MSLLLFRHLPYHCHIGSGLTDFTFAIRGGRGLVVVVVTWPESEGDTLEVVVMVVVELGVENDAEEVEVVVVSLSVSL